MSGPESGKVRVCPTIPTAGMRPGRWVDVDETDPRLADWLEAGFVSLVGPHGEGPPAELARPRCCGES